MCMLLVRFTNLNFTANEMHHSHGGLSGIYAVTLPPLSTLPSWSRSSIQHKQKLSLQPDKLRPLASCAAKSSRSSDISSSKSNSPITSDKEENVLHVLELYKQKVKYLTGNIDFLKDEHAKILKSLHEEIERMKYENKELKFKLIISDGNSPAWMQEKGWNDKKESKSAVSNSPSRRNHKVYEEEINSLRENLNQEKNKNKLLQDQINAMNPLDLDSNFNESPVEYDLDVPNTIEECYALISSLRSENDAQQKEIAYLQGKLSDQDNSHHSQTSDQCRVMSSLPALRPALQSKVVHRMKRQQIMTKEKIRHDILKEL